MHEKKKKQKINISISTSFINKLKDPLWNLVSFYTDSERAFNSDSESLFFLYYIITLFYRLTRILRQRLTTETFRRDIV